MAAMIGFALIGFATLLIMTFVVPTAFVMELRKQKKAEREHEEFMRQVDERVKERRRLYEETGDVTWLLASKPLP